MKPNLFCLWPPTLVAFNSPSLNNNIVGIPRTPYFVGKFGSSSMLCFAIVTSFISIRNFFKSWRYLSARCTPWCPENRTSKILCSLSKVSNVSSVDFIVAIEFFILDSNNYSIRKKKFFYLIHRTLNLFIFFLNSFNKLINFV